MPIRVLLRDGPQRAIALGTETHVLIFQHSTSAASSRTPSASSVNDAATPKCVVEFSTWEAAQMQDFRSTSSTNVQGTLGLVTINNDVFLCVASQSSKAATLRPGETVQRILGVEFHCLNRPDFDHLLLDQVNPFPTDELDPDGRDYRQMQDPQFEHPCMALKKLLSGGSFYYSADFDLTKRLQDRPTDTSTVAIDSLDAGFLWNAYMIQPLVDFRSRLSEQARLALDESRILTSAIRGFALTVAVPASSSPARNSNSGMPSNLTLISRLSCRRAGTRFNARGIDDDGNVANFVETETIYCNDDLCFSYVQIRGSVPLFWEQASGLPGQQKVTVTRSMEATQPAFDKHFEAIFRSYGDVFVVNLLSEEKPSEIQLTRQYFDHIDRSTLNARHAQGAHESSEHKHIQSVNYDFHAETRGPNGYEAASGIKRWIMDSAQVFDYYLSEEGQERSRISAGGRRRSLLEDQKEVLKQAGVFRTNCMDCLDRTNLVQTIISQMAIELFLEQRDERSPASDFWARHGMLWADCGDALSKIYAGTGALKSSFTRHGKMSLAGAIADVRKSAQRLYINNFEDKGRQNTIDMLLGRLIGQVPVHLYDPVYDFVTEQLARRAAEYTSSQMINIWVGTFNVNGKAEGLHNDLTAWLCPEIEESFRTPEIVAVAFQEIVELSPQQIMSTDPLRRQQWEEVVRKTLSTHAQSLGSEEYVLLRGGQLVGASLSVFVKATVLPFIKNVEGAVKKTGMSGMAGNKGAVAIRMEYADTTICLVTAHLAAGFANYQERNQDYQTISSGLRFQRNRAIHDHQTIIWFGDFNYRIGMSNDRARQLIEKRDLGTLYENDQLNLQMVHGKTFQFYAEKTPTFDPTYKYNLGTDAYDTSDKSRIPAWCDRILTKGDNLKQIYYEAAPLRFSDHRPVWGLFQARVSVIHQAAKDKIYNELYAKRRATVASQHPSSSLLDTDTEEESLHAGYESGDQQNQSSHLPPASSDRRKWWLDHGQPARSTIKPPAASSIPNPSRPANPFSPTSEPDWVNVERPSRTPSSASLAWTNPPRQTQQRNLAAPPARPQYNLNAYDGKTATPPPQPPRPTAGGGGSDFRNATANFEDTAKAVHLKQTLRKTAPPPKPKPNALRDGSAASGVGQPPLVPEARRAGAAGSANGGGGGGGRETGFAVPPRRATGGGGVPAVPPTRRTGGRGGEGTPDLPPRRSMAGAKGLMDEDDEDEVRGLGGWEALRPG